MTHTLRSHVLRLSVMFTCGAICQAAFAEPAERVTITIRIRDSAGVPNGVLAEAQARVGRIYRQAGIETVWRQLSTPSGDVVDRDSLLTIAILSGNQADRLKLGPSTDRVGVALSSVNTRGHVAYVFYERVESLTGTNGLTRASVLGVAIAHEIGHLLLPYDAHSPTGVMRASWARVDLERAQREELFFTSDQGDLMRNRWASRHNGR